MESPSSRLIVALDLPDRPRIVSMAKALRDHVAMVKVGLEAFVGFGPDLVRELVGEGLEVFLDLKLHDIPRTAAAAATQAGRLGARLLTVHAAGGPEMVRATREAARTETQVIAVTMLTSLSDGDAKEIGMAGDVATTTQRLAGLALAAGADGLVCSAHELSTLSSLGGTRVVPGVRPAGSAAEDQKRVATPESALANGATWIVVGRPIIQAPDPVAAARAIAGSDD